LFLYTRRDTDSREKERKREERSVFSLGTMTVLKESKILLRESLKSLPSSKSKMMETRKVKDKVKNITETYTMEHSGLKITSSLLSTAMAMPMIRLFVVPRQRKHS
jgi:hypothetical protein